MAKPKNIFEHIIIMKFDKSSAITKSTFKFAQKDQPMQKHAVVT